MKWYRIVWIGKITECGGHERWFSEDEVSEEYMLKRCISLNKRYTQLEHKLETKEENNEKSV